MLLNKRYELKEKLGQGGFAAVWRAYDRRLQRTVAVKILAEYLVALEGDAIIEQFQTEIRSVAKLRHPHVVTVHDADIDGSRLYFVMELLEGGDLAQRLAEHGPYAFADMVDLLTRIADGVTAAHAAGLIHRDIKPQNILFTADGRPVVTDFGLVKVLSGSLYASNPAFSGGKLLGTPEYMAPEQAHSRPVDARTDVYALGIVAYQLLTGAVPFKGDSALSTLFLGANTPRETLVPNLDGVPAGARAWLLRALAVEPEARPETPADLIAGWRRELDATAAADAAARERRRAVEAVENATRERIQRLRQQMEAAATAGEWPAVQAAARALLLEAPADRATRRRLDEATTQLRPRWRTTASGLPLIESIDQLAGVTPLPPTIVWAKDGKEMTLVPAGPFTMGITETEAQALSDQYKWALRWPMAATPAHRVTLPAFYVDVTPVTHAEYARFTEAVPGQGVPFVAASWARPYNWDRERRRPSADLADHPVVLVSWDDAEAYAAWAGKALPAEAQWEKAARGIDGRAYPWGNEWDNTRLNCAERLAGEPIPDVPARIKWWEVYQKRGLDRANTTSVGRYPAGASPYGALDMAGNVWEWCADWLQPYPGSQAEHDRFGETRRVLRGGSWAFISNVVRASYRFNFVPSDSSFVVGFRCAQEVHSP